MALSEYALSEEPIGGDLVGTFPGAIDYWLLINGTIETKIELDSIDIQDTQGGTSSARFRVLNPTSVPRAGMTVQMVWQDQTLFGGQLVTVSMDMDQASAVKTFACEAIGWMRILERRLITATYTNTTFRAIASDVLNTTLTQEGILAGTIDDGPTIDSAEGVDMRVSEFLRDTAEASGGVVYIDPYKHLHFRTVSLDQASFILRENDCMDMHTEEDLDQYRNKQTVTVTGVSGASVNASRSSATEIASRIALEGGTGIYEAHDSITSPSTDDLIELTKLGISYCLVKLAATARVRRTFKAKIRRPSLRLGQLIEVQFPAFNLSGQWQITRLRTWDEFAELHFEFEAQLTNFQQLALNSLLSIVGAARATVIMPVANYTSLDTYNTAGTFLYTVPGSGDVELEMTVYSAGGGGGAVFPTYWSSIDPTNLLATAITVVGQNGWPGGKAITYRSIPAGTVLTIIVGAAGTGGIETPTVFAVQPPGTNGGDTAIILSGERLAYAVGGGGGGVIPDAGPGTASGDFTYPGDGSLGGLAGGNYAGTNGASGNAGRVEIRY